MDTGENRENATAKPEGETKPTAKRKPQRASNSTSTADPGTGTGGTGDIGGNTGTAAPKVKSQNIPRPAAIGGGEVVDITPPPAVKRKKATAAVKPSQELTDLTANLTLFTVAAFSGISKAAGPLWNISQAEAEGIAAPLAKILDRLGQTETTNAVSDYIALSIALGAIVIPRVMLSRQYKQMKGGTAIEAAPTGSNEPVNQQPSSPPDESNGLYIGNPLA